MDNFILENKLKWFPYDEFENVEYLDKGGFGTIYKAIYKYNKVVLKCHNNLLSENLNEFLNEWEYHKSCLSSHDIIYFYGRQLNENLESRNSQAFYSIQSTSEKVNEESEDSQASVKVNEMLVSKNLDDCIFDLKSLDIKADKK
ncbi:kinase-like domain-containing protein [Rhizophagus irregularis DAOM 181602=DAOM 197198]|nr:kinase-like domain-containing protein [Rhizophagus irregularis DAOM 181602=DAOM 197198]